MARSTARKRALNTLYEADEKGQDILSLLDERLKVPGAPTPLPDYAVEIIRGVAESKRLIDRLLNKCSTTWKVSRMPVVDRNILRIGVWEILYNEEIPDKVAIDEALQLAKKLSDYDAPSFIHGVLSAVSHLSAEERLGEWGGQAVAAAGESTSEAVAESVDVPTGEALGETETAPETEADSPSVPDSAVRPAEGPVAAAGGEAPVTATESIESAESFESIDLAGLAEAADGAELVSQTVGVPSALVEQTLEESATATVQEPVVGESGQPQSETDNTQ